VKRPRGAHAGLWRPPLNASTLVQDRATNAMRHREYSHPALVEFADVAAAFCRVVTNEEPRRAEEQLDALHQLLPHLYAAALRLPDLAVLFDDTHTDPQAPTSARLNVEPPLGLAPLAEFLGPRRFYREVHNPYAAASEGEVTGDIIDDLADIYAALERGLMQWRSGATGNALWEWRFSFETHWAEHATSALRAIFALSAWSDVSWPTGAR
jgi:hypothetical protein